MGGTIVLTTGAGRAASAPAGDTINAASPSLSDVQAAVALASPGDTVVVPAGSGSATWTGSVTLTRGVHLQGPGRDALAITRGGTLIDIAPSAAALAANETFRITGFTFDAGGSSPAIQVTGTKTAPLFERFCFGDNRIQNTDSGGAAIWITNQVRGVIYNNIFDRCAMPVRYVGGDALGIWTAFGPTRAYGNADNLYFEDNTIQYSSSFSGTWSGFMYVEQCGRICARYNTWNMANATCTEFWDAHGSFNGALGTMLAEYYGNTMIVSGPYRWVCHRGGWGLYHNNLSTGTGSMGSQIWDQMANGDDSATGVPSQADNVYFWNNTHNGTEQVVAIGNNNSADNPLVNNSSRFCNLNTSFNGTTQHGVGRGTSVPGVSCNNLPIADLQGVQIRGDAYWVASTATPTVDSSIVQAGRLYKYIGDAWTEVYAPYTYPHPLRTY